MPGPAGAITCWLQACVRVARFAPADRLRYLYGLNVRLLAVLLVGCGADGEPGGDVGGTSPGASSDVCVDDEFQCAVYELVNSERTSAGESAFRYNPDLATAAHEHARDMSEQDYFSHASLDGRSFSDRVAETPYGGFATGENIALGQRSPDAVMNSWMNSEGHRNNILSSRSNEMGVGFVDNYWVQVFGRASDN